MNVVRLGWRVWALVLCGCRAGIATAACPATPEQFAATADRVTTAFISGEEGEIVRAVVALEEESACLSGQPSQDQVAGAHLAFGLGASYSQDKAASMGHFRAMYSVAGWQPPDDLAEFTPVFDWMKEAAAEQPVGPVQAYPLRAEYTLFVDARPASSLPLEQAAIVVISGPEGVSWSGVLSPGEVPPDGRWNEPDPPPPVLNVHPPRWPLIGSGVAAGGAAALWVAFSGSSRIYLPVRSAIEEGASLSEIGMSAEEIDALERRWRGLLGGASVATGAAIGLGITGLALQHRANTDAVVSVGPTGVRLTW